MTFNLRVPGDGIDPVISCRDAYEPSQLLTPRSFNPLKEFEIKPSRGTLSPQSQVEIVVTLCSNTIGKYDTALVVDVEGIAEALHSLQISAKYYNFLLTVSN